MALGTRVVGLGPCSSTVFESDGFLSVQQVTNRIALVRGQRMLVRSGSRYFKLLNCCSIETPGMMANASAREIHRGTAYTAPVLVVSAFFVEKFAAIDRPNRFR